MLENVFSIIGDVSNMQLSDDTLMIVTVSVFLFSIDWIFNLFSMAVATITKRR